MNWPRSWQTAELLHKHTTASPGEPVRVQAQDEPLPPGQRSTRVSVHIAVQGHGEVGATVVVETSDDGDAWVPWGRPIEMGGITVSTRDFVGAVTARFMRARITDLNGRNACVSVSVKWRDGGRAHLLGPKAATSP